MLVYRIERQKYIQTTLQGIGAASSEGFRWNSLHTHMVYTAESKSLAMLEIAVHLDLSDSLPTDRYYLEIDIPDALSIEKLSLGDLPNDWNSKPPLEGTQHIGDHFIFQNEVPVLQVPSAIIPSESNFLINPFHPKSKQINLIREEHILFDQRLFS